MAAMFFETTRGLTWKTTTRGINTRARAKESSAAWCAVVLAPCVVSTDISHAGVVCVGGRTDGLKREE